MSSDTVTLYIKGNRDVEVTKDEVTLGDILTMECSDKRVIPKVKSLRILKIQKPGRQRYVISILEIIACIHKNCPGIAKQISLSPVKTRKLRQNSGT